MRRLFLICPFLFIGWSSPVNVPGSSFILSTYEIKIYYPEICDTYNPFDSAVAVIKKYEGWHSEKSHPYVGYGHKLQPGETFTHRISESVADSLLRIDLLQKCAAFRRYGKDSLLLGTLAYNVGEYRLLGTNNIPKSQLIRKLEAGNPDIYNEYISYRLYRGKVISSLERRRKEEYRLLFIND